MRIPNKEDIERLYNNPSDYVLQQVEKLMKERLEINNDCAHFLISCRDIIDFSKEMVSGGISDSICSNWLKEIGNMFNEEGWNIYYSKGALDEQGYIALSIKLGNSMLNSHNGHEYVEIAGIKWATMNIGAEKLTDGGLYFQWGDTQGYTAKQVGKTKRKKCFNWDDYKFTPNGLDDNDVPNNGITKYNITDGKTVLEASDDAAHANWGGKWRMPTTEEFEALRDATISEWTNDYQGSGVAGLVLTDKTDHTKKLFFPAAGGCYDGCVDYVGDYGVYWSSSLNADYGDSDAYYLYFSDGLVDWDYNNSRYFGYPVRGVVG